MSPGVIAVTVVWATPAVQDLVALVLPAGATAGDALARSGLVERYRIDVSAMRLGIGGRRIRADTRLERTAPTAAGSRSSASTTCAATAQTPVAAAPRK